MVDIQTKPFLPFLACGLISGLAISAPGCDGGDVLGDIAEQCGLTCDGSLLEGNASISGVASVDAFFGAVIDVSTAANNISGTLRAELDAIALSVGLEAGAGGAEIAAAIEGRFAAALDGGIKVEYQAPKCEASVDVSVAAAAECDVDVDPGSLEVQCEGGCEVEGGVMASCEADATLVCTGTAPNFACEGSCTGDCELEVGASCEGTCRGTCDGTCSVVDAQGNCAGECMGMCQGTCELNAGGSCSGSCTGSCEYTPGEAGCEADASAKCEASADASVTCDAKCEGEATPPMVSAECEATVEAKANASLECTPPSMEVVWQWSAEFEGNPEAQAEFKAWMKGLEGHLSVMLAARTKADILFESIALLGDAGVAAIDGAIDVIAEGNFAASFKVTTCALPELENVAGVLNSAGGELSGNVEASLSVFGAAGIN